MSKKRAENNSPDNHNGRVGACPICMKSAAREYKPFCSKRCAEIDLHRWLSGGYAIPAVEGEDDRDPSGEK